MILLFIRGDMIGYDSVIYQANLMKSIIHPTRAIDFLAD